MPVWFLVVAYCIWLITAPKMVLSLIERITGNRGRFREFHVRLSGVLFLLFLISLLIFTYLARR
jgi:hypothetical protein